MPGYIRKGGKTRNKKNTLKGGKKNTCKRRRVRISANGSYNKSDMKHNKDCERKHMAKTVTKPSVIRSKKQGGKNNTKHRGGNPDEERAKQVAELMKQWKPVEGKGPLPDIPARKIATDVKETEAKEFKDFLREHVRSFDPKWRREDEFTAYRQNPRNIGLGKPFTAEQVVRYYADGFRDSEVRPDGLEKTLPGTTQEWYMILPGGGWGNHPSERKGPFSANEIGNFIFTNTKLVDHSIPEKDRRPQTLSAYLRGEGRRLGPRTTLGYRPAGALKSLRTERDNFKRGWISGGGKRKTRKRRGGNPDDKKKTYEKKLEDYENELADYNKTVADSKEPVPSINLPWRSVPPYDRTQVFVPPEPPIDPFADPSAGPAAAPAAAPAAGRATAPPLTQEEREELERTLREIREQEEEEEYERWQEQDSKIRGLYGRRW